MSMRLPLIAAQPGIWMAETLSTLPHAWSVAHYVELHGEIDGQLLAKAIVAGLVQVDTVRMHFAEDHGEITQWVDEHLPIAEPLCYDLRDHADPQHAAHALMQVDLTQNNRVDSGNPLYCHQLFQLGDNHWFWYQRYHHLLVDGFSFPAITRQISLIYQAWRQGQPTPENVFTPFAEVVAEYQNYQQSDAFLRDKAFWAEQRKVLPSPLSLSSMPLPSRAESAAVWRLKLCTERHIFSRLTAAIPQCQPADVALALVALWLGSLGGRSDYAACESVKENAPSSALRC